MDEPGTRRISIVTILGSRRKNGNTELAVTELEDRLRNHLLDLGVDPEKNLAIRRLRVSDLDLGECIGCRACFDKGEDRCPAAGDAVAIHELLKEADCAILTSPVYVNDVSGALKTLIDRLAFVCHRPAYFETPFYLLSTTAGSPTRHAIRTMQSAAISWGAPIVGSVGIRTGARSTREEIHDDHGRRVDREARRLARYIIERRHRTPSFISLLVFAIQQSSWRRELTPTGAADNSIHPDQAYWDGNGWFAGGCTFFFPHGAGPVKTRLARLVGKSIARVFG